MSAPHRPKPPTLASPGRRLFHLLIAVAGWVLFTYWWLLVLGRVSGAAVRFSCIFVVATTIVCVAITALWTVHNRLIWKRKGPRSHVRAVVEDWSHDRLGRAVLLESAALALANAPVVEVGLDPDDNKTYRALSRFAALPEGGALPDEPASP